MALASWLNNVLVGPFAGTQRYKDAVRVACASPITKSGEQTIQGVGVLAGERVLLAGQTDAAENGIWVCATGAWARSTDANQAGELLAGVMVYVEEGTFAGRHFVLTTTGTIYCGVTSQSWSELSALFGPDEDWSMPVVMDRTSRMTFGDAVDFAPVDELAIAISAAGPHVNGTARVLFILADSVTSNDGLRIAPDLHLDGDAFDCTKDYVILIEYQGDNFFATARSLAAREAVVPTLVSAVTPYANQNALELTFSEAAYIDEDLIAGITLAFSVGTARTVASVESGNGTTTVVLGLSGNVAASDVFTVSIAAETVQDMNGNWLAADPTNAVTNNVGEPVFADTLIFLRGDNLGADGSSITTWTDQSGEGNDFTQATSGERPTVLVDAGINNQKCVNFDGTDDSLYNVTGFLVDGAAAPDDTSYTMLLVWKHDGTSSDIPVSLSDNTSAEFAHIDLVRDAGTLGFYCGNNVNYAGAADSSTSWRYAWGIHRGASRDLYIDGALLGTSAVAVNPLAPKYGRLGRGIATGAYPLDGKIAELRIVRRELTTQELTDWENYVATRYGL